MNTFGERFDF